MKLGIYNPDGKTDDGRRIYEQLALYDFETGHWSDSSDGRFVSQLPSDPSPKDIEHRYGYDKRGRIVATPTELAEEGYEISVPEPKVPLRPAHLINENRPFTRVELAELMEQLQQSKENTLDITTLNW
jgi:hypothetical protein